MCKTKLMGFRIVRECSKLSRKKEREQRGEEKNNERNFRVIRDKSGKLGDVWLVGADVSVGWRAEVMHDFKFRMTDDWNPRHP
jgi:hypothetical protein